jgi:hypothetical protein
MEYANGALGYIVGPGLVPQLLLTVLCIVAVSTVITIFETVVDAVRKFDRQTNVLFADTTPARLTITQSPKGDNLIYNSENEVNGMEFSYSMYLFISPETFEETSSESCGTTSTGSAKLKHIMHKGSKDGFPLMAPGLFVHGDKNTLRIYMNSSTKWDNYVEVPNVPVGKWFHIVVVMKGKYLDVFVNGNVTVRHEFPSVPKLNYGSIYVMTPVKFPKNASDNVDVGDFKLDSAAKGMVSRLKYYAYALNYSQIDGLLREGPSKNIVSNSYSEVPPYFHDDWWVNKY